MADAYFVRFRGRTVGPYSLTQAQQMARKGQLSRSSEVSSDGQSWSPAASFPEIFERAATLAAAPGKASALTPAADLASGGETDLPAVDAPKGPNRSEWFYASGDEQKGPTSGADILAMLKAGTFSADDRVWREGLDNWVSVSDVPEFRAAIGLPAPLRSLGVGSSTEGGVFCRECGARINRKAVICTHCGVPTEEGSNPYASTTTSPRSPPIGTLSRAGAPEKSRTVAALLALLLGGLGAHHFYLGNTVLGVIYLVFCLTFIPALVALIEGIVFLCMSDELFNAKYNS